MAERYVRMNILSSGAEKAKATLDDLAMRARKLEAESPDLKITADDTKAQARIKDLKLKIDILNRQKAEVAFETRGDETAKAKLLDISARLHKLNEMVAKPEIKIGDADRTEARLIRIKMLMDSIHNKRVDVTLAENRKGNFFTRGIASLFGGGGGGGGGIGSGGAGSPTSGILSSLGGASNAYTGAGIVGIAALLGSLVPALLPLAIGGGVGLGAAAGAGALGDKAAKQLQALGKQLGNAKGDKKKSILAQMQAIRKQNAPELSVAGAFGDIGSAAKGMFTGALTANAPAPGIAGLEGDTIGGTSFMAGLVPILKQIAGFTKELGPGLAQMFRASLPFLSMFTKSMEQLAILLMPALTQAMKELTPYLPQIMQGFKFLSEGIADFIKDLGPGIKPSVTIFKAVMIAVKGILIAMAATFDFLAKGFVHAAEQIEQGITTMHKVFDTFRHQTAVIFDGIRHDVAAIWDSLWSHTIGALQRNISHLMSMERGWRHDIAVDFDTMRHTLASIWDSLWHNIESGMTRPVATVIVRMRNLGTSLWDAIRHLPGIFYQIAKNMVENIWAGARSVAGKVTGFFRGLGHGILSALGGVFHFGSPSKTMYKLGQFIVQGLHNGIQHKFDSLGGSVGSGAKRWLGIVTEALSMEGLPIGLAPRVLYQIGTESGGNPSAINLTDVNARNGDPSRGLLQTIMTTFMGYHWPGTSFDIFNPLANVAAAINYARHTYGPTLMRGGAGLGSGHGYAKGGPINEPIFGIGMRTHMPYTFGEGGKHEYVVPGGPMARHTTYVINVTPTPMAHPADIGREVVDAIKYYEQRNGKSWRS